MKESQDPRQHIQAYHSCFIDDHQTVGQGHPITVCALERAMDGFFLKFSILLKVTNRFASGCAEKNRAVLGVVLLDDRLNQGRLAASGSALDDGQPMV